MISPEEADRRIEFLESLRVNKETLKSLKESAGRWKHFEYFEYVTYLRILNAAGIKVSQLPEEPSNATEMDRDRMRNIYETWEKGEALSPSSLFSDCRDVREKIARLTELSEADLVFVADDLSIEFTVRKYAQALLTSDIKEIHEILNQALGKPLERKLTENRNVNAFADLSTEEIRAYLGEGEEAGEEMEIEVLEDED